jgi:hypothetical protein
MQKQCFPDNSAISGCHKECPVKRQAEPAFECVDDQRCTSAVAPTLASAEIEAASSRRNGEGFAGLFGGNGALAIGAVVVIIAVACITTLTILLLARRRRREKSLAAATVTSSTSMSSRRASSRHMVRRAPSLSSTRHTPTRPPPSASTTYQYESVQQARHGSSTMGNQYEAATSSFAPYQPLASPYVSSVPYQGVSSPMKR